LGRSWRSGAALSLLKVTGETDPIAGITRLAEELVDEAGLDGPPSDLRMLASFQGIRCIRPARMVSAARLVPEGGALVIEVNENHSLGKQNFSVGHEITHTLFPTYSGEMVEDEETGEFRDDMEEELLCDVGASVLLLPERWLRPVASELGSTLHTLFHTAERFEASLQATARKLTQIDLWPCAIVFWEEGFRKSERIPEGQSLIPGLDGYGYPTPKLRVNAAYTSRSFGHFIPRNKSVHEDSVIVACRNSSDSMAAVERFDLGHAVVTLHCESIWAPYRLGNTLRNRAISLLLPVTTHSMSFPSVPKVDNALRRMPTPP
jgi:hypothetical protein